jgi:bacterioferritin-associated ferredoxin
MLVCACNTVSQREIRACVANGASTVAEVGEACGAGTGCGGCRSRIRALLSTPPTAGAGSRLGTAVAGRLRPISRWWNRSHASHVDGSHRRSGSAPGRARGARGLADRSASRTRWVGND